MGYPKRPYPLKPLSDDPRINIRREYLRLRQIELRKDPKYRRKQAKYARTKRWTKKMRMDPKFRVREQAGKRRRRQLAKIQAFALFGSKCIRCKFDDIRALQIDHIFGDNRKGKRFGGHPFYCAILRGEVRLKHIQLLCANCNVIKRFENGESGHYKTQRKIPFLWIRPPHNKVLFP